MAATSAVERVWRGEFAVTGDTARVTRRWLRSSLCEYVARERLDTAVLLTDEIVASSARRTLANQRITVLVTLEAQLLRVEVIDAEHDRNETSAAAMRGPIGGLIMVGRNARGWGMTLGPPGRVWFEI